MVSCDPDQAFHENKNNTKIEIDRRSSLLFCSTGGWSQENNRHFLLKWAPHGARCKHVTGRHVLGGPALRCRTLLARFYDALTFEIF